MSLIRMGLGSSAALLLTLGLASAPAPANAGSYVTLGYGESGPKVVTLGLAPRSPTSGGSYITFGQGQSASLFATLGLTPGTAFPPVVEQPGGGGRFPIVRIPVDRAAALRLQRDDELILFIASAAVACGLLDTGHG